MTDHPKQPAARSLRQDELATMQKAELTIACGETLIVEELSIADLDSMSEALGKKPNEWGELVGDQEARFVLRCMYFMTRFCGDQELRMSDKPRWSFDEFQRLLRISDSRRISRFLENNPAFLSAGPATSGAESTPPEKSSGSAGKNAVGSPGESSESS